VEVAHPALALGLRRALGLLRATDRLGVQAGEELVGLRPRLLGGRPCDDVQADAEAQLAAREVGALADAVELLGDLRRRLAPRQVDVGVLRGDVYLTWRNSPARA
jgi:hypothetical protein